MKTNALREEAIADHKLEELHKQLHWYCKLILRLAGVFVFQQITLPLKKFAYPCFRQISCCISIIFLLDSQSSIKREHYLRTSLYFHQH